MFPLPLVLFPGTSQPLHVFEPRYQQLLADCLAGDHRFGTAYVPPTDDPAAAAAPRPGDVGCIAVIRTATELPDGRANILTEGERRFVLLEWCDPRPDRLYRLARVEEFDDEATPDDSEMSAVAAAVRHGFARLARALSTLAGRELEEPIELADDPTTLSFQVAAALELDAQAKRALQASRSTPARLRQLAALLDPIAAEMERRAVVRERGKRNGRGGAHPQIEHTT